MGGDLRDLVRQWLAAEGHDDQAADAAFRDVFRAVPHHDPPAAFAEGVLAALQAGRRGRAWFLWDLRLLRPLTAIALTMAGLVVLGVMGSLPVTGMSSFVWAWSSSVADGVRVLTRTMDVGLRVWTVFVTVGTAAQAVVATPWVSGVLVVNGAVALAGFCVLRKVLGPHEEVVSW